VCAAPAELHVQQIDQSAVRRGERPNLGKKVAVIGSGPAGLACAHDLAVLGYRPVVFEKTDQAMEFISSGAGEGFSAVTLSGVYFCRGRGIYYSGTTGEEISLLGRSEEIEKIGRSIEELTAEVGAEEKNCAGMREEKESLSSLGGRLDGEIAEARIRLSGKMESFQEIERDHITKKEKCSLLMKSLDELESSRVETMSKLEFFFDCSSPWTYLAFESIQPIAARDVVEVVWKPILVGGIFNSINPSVYENRARPVPAKARYYQKDLQDWARFVGIQIGQPPVFPVNSVKVMRGAFVAIEEGVLVPYARAAFRRYWGDLVDISQEAEVRTIAAAAGLDVEAFMSRISPCFFNSFRMG